MIHRCISNRYYPLWTRVDQGVMAIKGYSTFPRISASSSNGLASYPGHNWAVESMIYFQRRLFFSHIPHLFFQTTDLAKTYYLSPILMGWVIKMLPLCYTAESNKISKGRKESPERHLTKRNKKLIYIYIYIYIYI